jgi:hypothetical protein
MADNITAPGTGSVVAAELISGAYLVRNKIALGTTDVDGGNLAQTNGMPVSGNEAKDGSGTEHRLLTDTSGRVLIGLNQVGGSNLALGQQLAAASVPVVLTAAQLTSLTAPVLGAGSAKVGVVTTDQTTHGTTDLVAADVTKIGGSALALGQQLAAASVPVVLTAAQITSLTAPVLGAGSAKVGVVTTDQTTHGTTDLVAADVTKVGGTALALGQTTASASIPVTLPEDGVVGAMNSLAVTLSGTLSTVTTITLPNTAQGIRLYPHTNPIVFAFGSDTVASQATSSSTTIAAAAFSVGNLAKNDNWEVRLIAPGSSRTLHLLGTVASTLVDVECF